MSSSNALTLPGSSQTQTDGPPQAVRALQAVTVSSCSSNDPSRKDLSRYPTNAQLERFETRLHGIALLREATRLTYFCATGDVLPSEKIHLQRMAIQRLTSLEIDLRVAF